MRQMPKGTALGAEVACRRDAREAREATQREAEVGGVEGDRFLNVERTLLGRS